MAHDTPLFKRLATSLSEAIARGDYEIGEPLPTEVELMAQHGVSRHTVRAALLELKRGGIVAARRGIGTIVRRTDPAAAYVENYSSIDELLTFAAGSPVVPSDVDMRVPALGDARALGLTPGRRYLMIKGLRYGRLDQPVALVRIFLDARYGTIADKLDKLDCSIAELLEREFDVRIGHIDQEIDSTFIDPAMADPLQIAAGTPALKLTRWYFASGEQPVEVSESIYPHGRFVYRNQLVRTNRR